MDTRWQPLSRDAPRDVALQLFDKTATPASILGGQAPVLDLTPFTSRLEQSESQLTFALAWHRELDGVNLPQAEQWVLVKLGGRPLCMHQIESLNDYRVQRGVRQVSVTARSREARLRDTEITTRSYPMGASAVDLVLEIGSAMGCAVSVPQLGTVVLRGSVQLSGVSAWTALEQVMLPGGLSPFIDALGRLRGAPRDVLREADIVLSEDRVESFVGSRSRSPITHLTLRWRDPRMALVAQAERVLAETSTTAGFFKLRQVHRVYFSKDRTQRAINVRMHVVESVNGLIPVAHEEMEYIDHDSAGCTGVAAVVTTRAFIPAFISIYTMAQLLAAGTYDYAVVAATISWGRLFSAGTDIAMLMVLMSFGEGQYQFLGQPLEAVDQVNQTVAYDPTAPASSSKREILESDFVKHEAMATGFVTREFIYRVRAATSFTLNIVDDPRIEVGDILQLGDGTRLYVTGYRRDLSHGAPALLELTGFPA